MSGIEVRELTKCFGQGAVVDKVSFGVDQGEFLVILGPSGCGKSTILRMIAGLEEPDNGQIRMNGENVCGVDPSKRGISMVFQSYAQFPHLSVAENIVFGLKVRKRARAERKQRLEQVADMVGLSGVLDKKPAQLSGGQRQRVALARAVIAKHPVCLMDEPLSNLDAKLRHEMRVEIRSLQRRLRLSVVYVTHDQTEAMSMADKVLVLNNGRVEQLGKPEEVYRDPATSFVAKFIGAPPMNFIPFAALNSADSSIRELIPVKAENGYRLGVRPENLRLMQSGHGLPVKVSSTDYHGADTMVGVFPAAWGTDEIGEIMVRVPGRMDLSPGESRMLTWGAEDILLFDTAGNRQGRLAALL